MSSEAPDVFASTLSILHEVADERSRQRLEYDDSQHTAETWIARLAKHIGLAVTTERPTFRRQMIRVAAIAVAAVEWHDRRFE